MIQHASVVVALGTPYSLATVHFLKTLLLSVQQVNYHVVEIHTLHVYTHTHADG